MNARRNRSKLTTVCDHGSLSLTNQTKKIAERNFEVQA
jgi:hypothetical protein